MIEVNLFSSSVRLNQIQEEEPLDYQSLKSQSEYRSKILDEEYFQEYNQLRKIRQNKNKKQIEKLSRIIKDAQDLNQILQDANKWIKKNSPQKKKKKKN